MVKGEDPAEVSRKANAKTRRARDKHLFRLPNKLPSALIASVHFSRDPLAFSPVFTAREEGGENDIFTIVRQFHGF